MNPAEPARGPSPPGSPGSPSPDPARPPPDPGAGYGRSVVIALATVALMSAMALVPNIAIARLAGPEARGLYGIVVAIGALAVPLASLGLGPATTWQLGRGERGEAMLSLLMRAAAISCVLGLTIGALTLGLREHLQLQIQAGDAVLVAIGCAALTLPAQVIVEFGRSYALGQRRPLLYNLLAVAVLTALVTLNLVTAWRGQVQVLINLAVANWVVALALIARALWARRQPPSPELQASSRRYGRQAALVTLGDAALLRIDTLLAGPFIGLAALGVYAIADQISHLLAMVGLLAGKMMLPESASDHEGERSLAKLGLACRLLVAFLLVASAVAIAVGRWLIPALFGPAFAGAYVAMVVLLPAALLKGLSALISTWLAGRGVQRPTVRAGAAGLGFEIVAVVTLAATVGWIGVAVAKTGGYVIQFGVCLRALDQHRPGARALIGWIPRPEDGRALVRWLSARAPDLVRRRRP